MKLIKVAAGVVNQTPLAWQRNCRNIIAVIKKAKQKEVSILCLPEMSISGYGCEDAFYSPSIHATAAKMLERIIPETANISVCVGLPLMHAGGVFNAICWLVNGEIAGFVAKQHLAGDGIHYEQRWFKPWPRGVQAEFEFAGQIYPLGDLLFDVGGVRVGFEICEDAWVGNRPGADHARRGADIILNPSASHFAFGKHNVRQRFVVEGSRAFNVSYVYTNLVGNESGRAIFDGDAMIASCGDLLASGPRLSFQETLMTAANVDIDKTRMIRARTGSFQPDVDGDESDVIKCDFEFPSNVDAEGATETDWHRSKELKCEEFTRAVALGLLDYMVKSRSRGYIISLSGGADSASAAVLVAMAIQLAFKELGSAAIGERFDGLIRLDTDQELTPAIAIENLLTTVYQATENSGDVTRSAAAEVARALGAVHYELDVQPMVDNYICAIEQAVGHSLTWNDHDITLQNIQARSRAPSVWMLANIKNALLLSTSNRSEAAVGYATMDGDTCGGLSPLAGIDKAFLRQWLSWMERVGPLGIEPLAALAAVNRQQPTAELRPADSGQTDESDLMPYPILDRIERYAIRDKKMPLDVFHKLVIDYPEHRKHELGQWTIKFFRLWCRNQWKRERYAPSFHLDDENLDPKTWCRFPILSGGYELEIDELQTFLQQSNSLK